MRSCCAIWAFSSMLTLTSFTAPFACSTTRSSNGPSVLQGPHHGAQKSTITGPSSEACSTSVANVAMVASLTFADGGPDTGAGAPAPPLPALVRGLPPGPISAMIATLTDGVNVGRQGLNSKPLRTSAGPPQAGFRALL